MEGDGKSWGMEKHTGRAQDHICTRDVFSLWLHIVWRAKLYEYVLTANWNSISKNVSELKR